MPRYAATIQTPDGGHAIIHSGKPIHACSFCVMELSVALCDYPIGGGCTCDRRIGPNCRTHIEPDTDYCPNHRPDVAKE